MRPQVFISSSVKDLRHIRDAARKVVLDLGYEPVMSEYGEVGYMGADNAIDACYRDVQECQVMILIIGLRYGGQSERVGTSVTEREWENAIDRVPHILTLVDQDVLKYKEVYEDNQMKDNIRFSSMDNPMATFSFINKVMASKYKNGIIPYSSTIDVQESLKKQFAALFYIALTDRTPKTEDAIQNILYEIKSIKAEYSRPTNKISNDVKVYRQILRGLMEQPNDEFSQLLKGLGDEIDDVIPYLISATSFDAMLENMGYKVTIRSMKDIYGPGIQVTPNTKALSAFIPRDKLFPLMNPRGMYEAFAVYVDKQVSMTKGAYEYFVRRFEKLRGITHEDIKSASHINECIVGGSSEGGGKTHSGRDNGNSGK